MNTIRFAIIGLGHIGRQHLKMIDACPGAQLVAYCNEEKVKDVHVPYFSTIQDVLTSGIAIDVVTVCTPSGMHAEQAIYALEHNCHVLCEKPLTISSADAKRMINTAAQYSKKIFCVMQNRFSPISQWLKQLVTESKLGKIYQVELNCFWNRNDEYYTRSSWHGKVELDGGMLFTQFSHFIDTLLWVFGDIQNISSKLRCEQHSFFDSAVVTFDFCSGGMGVMNFSTLAYEKNYESSITILAEQGIVKVSGQYMDRIEYCNVKNCEIPTFVQNDHPNHFYVIQNVVDVLNGKSAIAVGSEDGLKVVELIERIYTQTL